MNLPDELKDLLPLPPRERHHLWNLIDRNLEILLSSLNTKNRQKALIENHKAKLKYHQDKLKETELRLAVYESQFYLYKEKVKKDIESLWEDIREDEEKSKG